MAISLQLQEPPRCYLKLEYVKGGERPRKRQATPNWEVAVLIRRELTYRACLGQLQDEWISIPVPQNLESLYTGLNCVQVHILSR